MSDPLTEAAPEVDPSASPVGEQADGETFAADEASGSGKTIPVERFNGLMSKFNETNAALNAEREARVAIEQKLTQLEAQLTVPPAEDNQGDQVADGSNETIQRLQEQVANLTELLLSERSGSTKEKLLDKYPAAKPFADLINADPSVPADQLEEVVKQVAEIAQGLGAAETAEAVTAVAEAQQEAAGSEEAEVEPPVSGTAAEALTTEPSETETRIAEAIKNRDFQALWRAKNEAAQAQVDGLVLQPQS